MKKKILVPIMALAIAVTAGVNYKMISSCVNTNNMSLSSLVKMTFAEAESVCGNCGKSYCPVCSGVGDYIEDYEDEEENFNPDDYAQYESGWDGCPGCGATYRFCAFETNSSCTTPDELGCVADCGW